MATVNLPVPDLSSIKDKLAGNKTYIALIVGMAVIAANHFGVLPDQYKPAGLNPADWVNDEFKLVVAAFFRAGIAKAGSDAPPKESVVAVPDPNARPKV